jgi:prepilin-type processing-associated H-X9-DG protein
MPSPYSLTTTTNLMPEMVCPSYLHALPGITSAQYNPNNDNYNNAFSYSLTRTNNPPCSQLSAAGYPFGDESSSQPSLSMANLSGAAPLAQVWALADLDWLCVDSPPGLGSSYLYFAMTPVHVTVRNYLYFDGHAADKRVNGYTNY